MTDFPQTLVINLADRTDKWAEVQDSFKSWPVPLERLDAVRMKPGWKGCAASHLKAIRTAKERGLDMVIILEDDALLAEDGLNRFVKLLPILRARRNEWDIFLGGSTSLTKLKVMNREPELFQATAYTTHFCLVNSDAYDKILNGYDPNGDDPIDVFYKREIRLWMTNPHIAIQRPGLTDIGNKVNDYTRLFDKAGKRMAGAIWNLIALHILIPLLFFLLVLFYHRELRVMLGEIVGSTLRKSIKNVKK